MADPVRRVALLLQGWGGWHSQLMRGVQTFAQSAPHWRLHIDGGLPGTSRVESKTFHWDGIISAVIRSDGILRRLYGKKNTKIVGMSSAPYQTLKIPVVRVDDSVIADALGEHLLAGGFRQFAYVGPLGWGRIDHRAAAIKAFAESRSLPFIPFIVKRPEKSTMDSAFPMRQAIHWITNLPKPIGILVWNMAVAQHVVEACVRAGVEIPANVAVVSTDDDPIIAETSEPSITGLVFPTERIAFRAAQLLDDLMNGGEAPEKPILVPPARILHVRQSSDALSLPNRDVQLAVQYIHEHAKQALKVEHVARALGVSRSRLDENFVRVMGHTPHEELVRAHLNRAKQMLVETSLPIKRIAEECGFGTPRTLYRVFMERNGQTPAAYREAFSVRDANRWLKS